ncbi:hypothetical protein Tco_0743769 [Tanacetum coccineum]
MADDEGLPTFQLMAFSTLRYKISKRALESVLKNLKIISKYDKLRIELNKSESDLDSYKKGLASVEEQLVFYKKNESMLCDQIVVLKRDASFNESDINALKKQVERLKKEKEDNQFKIDNFENASKSLDQLIGNQISDNNKKAVLTKSGLVPFSTARQSFSRTTAPVSAARSFNTAVPSVISVNTVKGKRMTSAVGEQEINVVKPTAYWAWRPKIKMINHVYKNTGSCICKQFNYVDPTGRNKSVMAWVPKIN